MRNKVRVLVKQMKNNKLTPAFNPIPYIVTENKGDLVSAFNPITQHTITRNTSHYKQIPHQAPLPPIKVEEEEEEEINISREPNTHRPNQEVNLPTKIYIHIEYDAQQKNGEDIS